MKKRIQKLWALALTLSICVTTMAFTPVRVAASGQFATCLGEITGETGVTKGYNDFATSENLSKYLGKSGTTWAYNYAKTANGIKFFDYGGFDEWIPTETNYYGAYRFNLGAVSDVYGANKGIYEYNIDFNLNLSENDSYSSINNRRCFVLGFGNGVTISPSALNFYNDKITQSEVHSATDNQVVLYDGTVANGVYHLKYTFKAGASAANSRVTAVLTTPGNSQIVLLNNEKLRVMPGEINSSKTWDTATETDGTTTLGWMTVAARMPWSTSYIEITNATFREYEPNSFDEWFTTCLSKITNGTDTIGNAPSTTYLRPYAGDNSALSWIGYTKTDNAIRVKSNGTFDAWSIDKYNYYAGIDFNLGAVTDIYGVNKGVYVYDVDFDLNLSDDDIYASSINDKRRNVFLSFGSGKGLSISGINFFHDRITQSEVHAANKESLLYEGTLANGTYHLRYIFTAGASAAESKITAVLTPPNGGADIVLINDAKLTYMPGEKGESWDTVTEDDGTTSLGWMTVGARQALSGSYIEVTNATFREYEPNSFDDWFANLPTLTDQSFTNMQSNAIVNNPSFVIMNEGNQANRLISTAPNSFKLASNQSWDETGSSDRRSNAILKLAQVDDIYGANQGTYLYDVDFNLTLTGEDNRAPLSTAGSRKMNNVYLGFFGGTTTESISASYSVINFYRDKAVESWERYSGDNSELATFDGDGLTDGKYNIKYQYIAREDASKSKVIIVLTKYNDDGVTLGSTPVMTIYKKLGHMIAETKETYSAETSASLGWLEIGVRTPYTGSGIEITKASFEEVTGVDSLALDYDSLTMEIGEEQQLIATVLPSNAYDKNVNWSSSNPSVVTVDPSGRINAVSGGVATITAKAGAFSSTCEVTVNFANFNDWFASLPTLTDKNITNIQSNLQVNNSNYAEMYDYEGQPYRYFSTSANSFKISSNQAWDETGGPNRGGHIVLKLANIDDIYGVNQGTYVYDVDFNLALTGEGNLAPLSDAGNQLAHDVYLGFFGGAEDEGYSEGSASYSVIDLYRDKAIESWQRDNQDSADIKTFDGDGLTDGKYNIKYEYITGSSPSNARVNITLKKYNAGGTLESTPIMEITGKKLKHMLAEDKETYSNSSKASLGWLEVGVRTPYTGSGIEITRASFGLKSDLIPELFISQAVLYDGTKSADNRIFSLQDGKTYSKLYADLFLEKLNTTPQNKNVMAMLALYDNGELVDADTKDCNFEESNNYACDFELNSFTANDTSVLKLFVWNKDYSPEDYVKEVTIGTDKELSERDLALIKSRVNSNLHSSSIDVSDITAKLSGGRFTDLTYDKSENCMKALSRVSDMLKAYFSQGNKSYKDGTLKSQIIAVLNDWANNDYQSSNIWYNIIGVPIALTTVICYPIDDLVSPAVKTKLYNIAKRGIPTVVEGNVHKTDGDAGANLTDKLIVAMKIAALTDDTSGLEVVSRLLENELQVFTPATAAVMNGGNVSSSVFPDYEGIAPDYSFKQHGMLYTGAYGKTFVVDVCQMLNCLRDTKYMPTKRALNVFSEFILEGYSPMFKVGGSDFSILGRNISRNETENAVRNKSRNAYDALTKYSQLDRRVDLMNLYDERLSNVDNLTTLAKHYWTSDYTVFHRPNFFVSVKNLSNRNIATEAINGENKYGFYLSDGATAILKTGLEYQGVYPVWDWSRIPGTTTTYLKGTDVQIGANENVSNHMYQTGTKDFVGGVTDGVYAVSAMDYEHKHDTDKYKTAAKKAVFMFDDGFVALGAGITGTDPGKNAYVCTTLNQCNLNGNVLYSSDNTNVSTLGTNKTELVKVRWIHHDGVAYIVPSAENIYISNESKSGSWNKINANGSETTISKKVFQACINHGIKANITQSYDYTVLPSATVDETKAYTSNPDMITVTNTTSVQSVWSKKANALGVVFYSSGTVNVNTSVTGLANTLTVSVANPCLVLLVKSQSGWKLSVSDPTNGNLTSTTVTVNGVSHNVTFPTGNYKGKSVTIDIQ